MGRFWAWWKASAERPAARSAPKNTSCCLTQPGYYKLIESFGKATGVPLLLNTSFNLRGEPIVNTPAEAVNTFHRSGMDVLVLGDYVVEKPPAR